MAPKINKESIICTINIFLAKYYLGIGPCYVKYSLEMCMAILQSKTYFKGVGLIIVYKLSN